MVNNQTPKVVFFFGRWDRVPLNFLIFGFLLDMTINDENKLHY